MKVSVFCSACEGLDRQFQEAAWGLAEGLARAGHVIVYGGTNMGLMGIVAEAARSVGGDVVGVVPRILKMEGGRRVYPDLTELVWCNNLSDRKDIMVERSDAIIALPGGIGTLDEVFTVAAANTIGFHSKRVILYDVDNFWQPMMDLLEALQQRGMIRGHYSDFFVRVSSLEELMPLLQ